MSQISAKATSQRKTALTEYKCDTIRLIKSSSLTINFSPRLYLYVNVAAKPHHNKKYTYPDNQSPSTVRPSDNRRHYNLIKRIYLHSFQTTRPLHPTAANMNPSGQASARRDFTLKYACSHLFTQYTCLLLFY